MFFLECSVELSGRGKLKHAKFTRTTDGETPTRCRCVNEGVAKRTAEGRKDSRDRRMEFQLGVLLLGSETTVQRE